MKVYKIAQLFEKYNDIIPREIENGEIYKLSLDEKRSAIRVLAKFDTLQNYDVVNIFEELEKLIVVDNLNEIEQTAVIGR